jgi:hypothetical protein
MTTPFREIVRLPEFERDIKRLLRRFRSVQKYVPRDIEFVGIHQIEVEL